LSGPYRPRFQNGSADRDRQSSDLQAKRVIGVSFFESAATRAENCDLRAIELDSRHRRLDGRAVEAV
jgi:hypothetical protein